MCIPRLLHDDLRDRDSDAPEEKAAMRERAKAAVGDAGVLEKVAELAEPVKHAAS